NSLSKFICPFYFLIRYSRFWEDTIGLTFLTGEHPVHNRYDRDQVMVPIRQRNIAYQSCTTLLKKYLHLILRQSPHIPASTNRNNRFSCQYLIRITAFHKGIYRYRRCQIPDLIMDDYQIVIGFQYLRGRGMYFLWNLLESFRKSIEKSI